MIWEVTRLGGSVYSGSSEALARRYWARFCTRPQALLLCDGRVIDTGRPVAPDSATPTTAQAVVESACAALRKLGASAVKARALIEGACAGGATFDDPAKLIEAAFRYNVKGKA